MQGEPPASSPRQNRSARGVRRLDRGVRVGKRSALALRPRRRFTESVVTFSYTITIALLVLKPSALCIGVVLARLRVSLATIIAQVSSLPGTRLRQGDHRSFTVAALYLRDRAAPRAINSTGGGAMQAGSLCYGRARHSASNRLARRTPGKKPNVGHLAHIRRRQGSTTTRLRTCLLPHLKNDTGPGAQAHNLLASARKPP